MIEKMKSVCVISQASHKTELLDSLRELGILHIAERETADEAIMQRFDTISKLSLELKDYASEEVLPSEELLTDGDFEQMYAGVLEALEKKANLEAKKTEAILDEERISVWGEFVPAEVKALKNDGLDFHFYRLGKKEYKALCDSEDVRFLRLAPVEKMETVAVLGTLDGSISATEFTLPEKGIAELKADVQSCDDGIAECNNVLKNASAYLSSYSDQLLKTQNDAEYSSVSRTVGSEDGLVWLSGYIPVDDEETFKAAAKEHGWAWHIEDIADDDEHVPTKVKYNKVTALMKPVFEILGTVPGYHEYDISFWFLAFFTLFFAMIIGDAGYGVIFLLGAIGITLKIKKTTNATLLLFVLSIATIIWGSLTGTWFGLEGAMKIPFLKALVIPTFANYPEYFGVTTTAAQNGVMKFCFSIGVIQLALACIMNIRKKIGNKDLSWVSDLGWLMAICALYFLVLYLVIGQSANMGLIAAIVIAGFLLVVIFGGMAPGKTFGQGLKAGVGDAFTVFLNTISAFGNVMSYIRLFAVGMASLAIAQSFNNMASGFSGAAVIAGAVIMIIGHVLNIVMGFLSVVVHGIRLNLLEFSGQLGMEWSGTAYEPFRKLDKIKK